MTLRALCFNDRSVLIMVNSLCTAGILKNQSAAGGKHMLYTEEQKKELEEMVTAFGDYLRDSEYLELVWSDKIGYILLKISVSSRSIPLAPVIIEDGEMLCEELFCEIANDVLEYTGNGHDRKNADPLERAEIRRRYQPYIEQFPQYQQIAEEILAGE